MFVVWIMVFTWLSLMAGEGQGIEDFTEKDHSKFCLECRKRTFVKYLDLKHKSDLPSPNKSWLQHSCKARYFGHVLVDRQDSVNYHFAEDAVPKSDDTWIPFNYKTQGILAISNFSAHLLSKVQNVLMSSLWWVFDKSYTIQRNNENCLECKKIRKLNFATNSGNLGYCLLYIFLKNGFRERHRFSRSCPAYIQFQAIKSTTDRAPKSFKVSRNKAITPTPMIKTFTLAVVSASSKVKGSPLATSSVVEAINQTKGLLDYKTRNVIASDYVCWSDCPSPHTNICRTISVIWYYIEHYNKYRGCCQNGGTCVFDHLVIINISGSSTKVLLQNKSEASHDKDLGICSHKIHVCWVEDPYLLYCKTLALYVWYFEVYNHKRGCNVSGGSSWISRKNLIHKDNKTNVIIISNLSTSVKTQSVHSDKYKRLQLDLLVIMDRENSCWMEYPKSMCYSTFMYQLLFNVYNREQGCCLHGGRCSFLKSNSTKDHSVDVPIFIDKNEIGQDYMDAPSKVDHYNVFISIVNNKQSLFCWREVESESLLQRCNCINPFQFYFEIYNKRRGCCDLKGACWLDNPKFQIFTETSMPKKLLTKEVSVLVQRKKVCFSNVAKAKNKPDLVFWRSLPDAPHSDSCRNVTTFQWYFELYRNDRGCCIKGGFCFLWKSTHSSFKSDHNFYNFAESPIHNSAFMKDIDEDKSRPETSTVDAKSNFLCWRVFAYFPYHFHCQTLNMFFWYFEVFTRGRGCCLHDNFCWIYSTNMLQQKVKINNASIYVLTSVLPQDPVSDVVVERKRASSIIYKWENTCWTDTACSQCISLCKCLNIIRFWWEIFHKERYCCLSGGSCWRQTKFGSNYSIHKIMHGVSVSSQMLQQVDPEDVLNVTNLNNKVITNSIYAKSLSCWQESAVSLQYQTCMMLNILSWIFENYNKARGCCVAGGRCWLDNIAPMKPPMTTNKWKHVATEVIGSKKQVGSHRLPSVFIYWSLFKHQCHSHSHTSKSGRDICRSMTKHSIIPTAERVVEVMTKTDKYHQSHSRSVNITKTKKSEMYGIKTARSLLICTDSDCSVSSVALKGGKREDSNKTIVEVSFKTNNLSIPMPDQVLKVSSIHSLDKLKNVVDSLMYTVLWDAKTEEQPVKSSAVIKVKGKAARLHSEGSIKMINTHCRLENWYGIRILLPLCKIKEVPKSADVMDGDVILLVTGFIWLCFVIQLLTNKLCGRTSVEHKLTSESNGPNTLNACYPVSNVFTVSQVPHEPSVTKSRRKPQIHIQAAQPQLGRPGVNNFKELEIETVGAILNIPHLLDMEYSCDVKFPSKEYSDLKF